METTRFNDYVDSIIKRRPGTVNGPRPTYMSLYKDSVRGSSRWYDRDGLILFVKWLNEEPNVQAYIRSRSLESWPLNEDEIYAKLQKLNAAQIKKILLDLDEAGKTPTNITKYDEYFQQIRADRADEYHAISAIKEDVRGLPYNGIKDHDIRGLNLSDEQYQALLEEGRGGHVF